MDPQIVAKQTEQYIQTVLKSDKGILNDLRAFAEENCVPIISLEVKKLLEVILLQSPRARILEIGTAIGYSSIFFAKTMTSQVHIDTIEVDSDMVVTARANIKAADLDSAINVICGDALEVLPCLTEQYDMVFVDGPKAKYIEMLTDCMRLLKNGGMLVTDNILYRGFVATPDSRIPQQRRSLVRNLREYIRFLCSSEELVTSIIPIGDGLSISIKR